MLNLVNINKIVPLIKIELYPFNQSCLFLQSIFLKSLLRIFKYHFKYAFKLLTCITAIDFPENTNRFKLVYEILSVKYNNRLRIKLLTNEISPVYSIEKIYIASVWWEYEVWDMFGVIFLKKANIVRLLTDYGFQGFPLRKDFPLSGFVDSKYNLIKNRISYDSLELTQNYRVFLYSSPWESYK